MKTCFRHCSRVACFMSPQTGAMAGIVNAVTSQFQVRRCLGPSSSELSALSRQAPSIVSDALPSDLSLCPKPVQSPEKKKEEFRQYLERSGVIDALTKVLVGLYEEPEKPANAIE